MIKIRNREITRMPGAGKWRSGFRSGVLFSALAAGAAVLAGITGPGYVTVLAADNVEQNQEMTGDDSLRLTWATSGNVDDSVSLCSPSPNVDGVSDSTYTSSNLRTDVQPEVGRGLPSNDDVNIPDSQADDIGQVYDFKDNKTTGTVTVTKVWDDGLTNNEREIPDIKISTKKPSKSTLGYTVTFHGNGLKFADGSETNEIVLNSSGQIVSGMFKVPGNTGAAAAISWYSDESCKNRVEVSDNGVPQMTLTGDLDLWVKEMTFEIKGYAKINSYSGENKFNKSIPSTVTEVIFTDEIKPSSAEIIDVDADGDGGVIAWTENDGTVMKVSTQIKGIKVQAAVNSDSMFEYKNKIRKIDLKMLDTSNVMSMESMFHNCRSLKNLDLTPLNTTNVTNMHSMFYNCSGLTSLDLTPLNTTNVTRMDSMFNGCSGLTSLNLSLLDTTNVTKIDSMFYNCSGLTSLDLTPLNTTNVTSMGSMFNGCSGLTSLDLTPLDTSKVTNMEGMFSSCSGLTSLDLTPLNTTNVTRMDSMFNGCSGLTSLDLTPLNTINVTNMNSMFSGCSGLTSLDLSPLNTQKVTDMNNMFNGCSGLTSLDLFPLNTRKVRNMSYMFSYCSGLTSLDLSNFNTQNVTKMDYMFYYCSGLTSLDLSTLDTQKVTNMTYMFSDCSGLTSLDLSNFNTQNVTSMGSMFGRCYGLTSLDLSTFDTQNVTSMGSMFSFCYGLASLDLSTFDTQNVTYMSNMFFGCNGLTILDLSSFNTQNVISMRYMLDCKKLKTIKTGTSFKFVGTDYSLSGTWRNTAGETFNGNDGTANFPSNVADTYTKISD